VKNINAFFISFSSQSVCDVYFPEQGSDGIKKRNPINVKEETGDAQRAGYMVKDAFPRPL